MTQKKEILTKYKRISGEMGAKRPKLTKRKRKKGKTVVVVGKVSAKGRASTSPLFRWTRGVGLYRMYIYGMYMALGPSTYETNAHVCVCMYIHIYVYMCVLM